MPEYIAIPCFDCRTAQCIQKPKSGKFVYRLCNAKQSVRKIFAISFQAKDIRPIVQQINTKRGEREWEREQQAREQADAWQHDEEGECTDENEYPASFDSASQSEAAFPAVGPVPAPTLKQSCWAGWTGDEVDEEPAVEVAEKEARSSSKTSRHRYRSSSPASQPPAKRIRATEMLTHVQPSHFAVATHTDAAVASSTSAVPSHATAGYGSDDNASFSPDQLLYNDRKYHQSALHPHIIPAPRLPHINHPKFDPPILGNTTTSINTNIPQSKTTSHVQEESDEEFDFHGAVCAAMSGNTSGGNGSTSTHSDPTAT